jgi:iron complex outermembrane recepter protein
MKSSRYPWLRSAGTTCLLSVGALATGQSLAQTPAAASLEEVVVTAERRESDLQETAVSVTAISSEKIAETHAANVRELAEYVPNLTIMPSQYGDAAPNVVIRGVGGGASLQSFGAAAERNVAMYIDGLYYPRSFGSIMKVTEVESVEVLRGPQGTLFGRNTTGGAISYHSKKASLENGLSGFVEGEAGNYGLLNFKGSINLPLGERWAALLGAARLNRDGYVERGNDPVNDDDTVAGHLQVHGEPTDQFTVDLSYSYTDSETHGTPSNFIRLTWNENPNPADITAGLRGHLGALSRYLVAAGQGRLVPNDPRLILGSGNVPRYCILDDNDPFTMGELCDTFNKNTMHVGSLRLAYDLNDNIQVSSLTGGIDTDVDTRTDSYYTGAYARDFAQQSTSFQQELQINFNYDNWHAVGGMVYFKEDAKEKELTTERLMTSFANNTDVLRTRRREEYKYTTDSYAAYGQASYSFTSWFELTGGLRYSEDKKTARIKIIPTPADARNRLSQGEKSWTSTDYKVSAQFRPMQDVMLFVSRSKAFKAGIADDASAELAGIPDLPAVNPILWANPEEVVAWEAGIRSEWFDNRLRVNLTYFDQDWKDRHTSATTTVDLGPPIGPILVFGTVNDPGIINIKGVEAELTYAITDSLTADFSYGYTDAESNQNPNFTLDSVPKFNYTAGLSHSMDVFGGKVSSTLNYTYRDKSYSFSVTEPDRNDPGLVDSYGLINANLSYTPDSGNWTASIYGRNLADEDYNMGSFAISGYGNTSFAGAGPYNVDPRVQFPGLPRTFGATLRYNFGR